MDPSCADRVAVVVTQSRQYGNSQVRASRQTGASARSGAASAIGRPAELEQVAWTATSELTEPDCTSNAWTVKSWKHSGTRARVPSSGDGSTYPLAGSWLPFGP